MDAQRVCEEVEGSARSSCSFRYHLDTTDITSQQFGACVNLHNWQREATRNGQRGFFSLHGGT